MALMIKGHLFAYLTTANTHHTIEPLPYNLLFSIRYVLLLTPSSIHWMIMLLCRAFFIRTLNAWLKKHYAVVFGRKKQPIIILLH